MQVPLQTHDLASFDETVCHSLHKLEHIEHEGVDRDDVTAQALAVCRAVAFRRITLVSSPISLQRNSFRTSNETLCRRSSGFCPTEPAATSTTSTSQILNLERSRLFESEKWRLGWLNESSRPCPL